MVMRTAEATMPMEPPRSARAVLCLRRKRFFSATWDRDMAAGEARTPTDKAFQSSYSQGGTRRQGRER